MACTPGRSRYAADLTSAIQFGYAAKPHFYKYSGVAYDIFIYEFLVKYQTKIQFNI